MFMFIYHSLVLKSLSADKGVKSKKNIQAYKVIILIPKDAIISS